MTPSWRSQLTATLLLLALIAGCSAPHRRPDGTLTDKPHGNAQGRIPRGGVGLADGTLPPGGDRCTAALIGRNGNPNLAGVVVGNVAYIASLNLPGTKSGMAPYDAGDGQDMSSTDTATGGAREGNGPPNGLGIMVDTVRQNCPHLAHIRLASDPAATALITSLSADVAAGRSIAGRLNEMAVLDAGTHIVGAGVTGSGSGGARGGQTGTGLPNAGGTGP